MNKIRKKQTEYLFDVFLLHYLETYHIDKEALPRNEALDLVFNDPKSSEYLSYYLLAQIRKLIFEKEMAEAIKEDFFMKYM